MKKVLVAAFGNELRGDDGFGIAVLRALEAAEPQRDEDVRLLEVGTGGLWLAQELMRGYDRLIVVDAVRRNTVPGTVCVLRVEDVADAERVDMHLAVPAHALSAAKALGALPQETFLVGCEPAEVDDLTTDLSDAVRRAVPVAAARVRQLMNPRPLMEPPR